MKSKSNYARTTITNQDGTIQTARINFDTGEVKPYAYNDAQSTFIKAKPKTNHVSHPPAFYSSTGDLLDYTPHWVKSLQNNNIDIFAQSVKPKKVRKSKDNTNNVYLKEYETLDDAAKEIEHLENVFTGVSLLYCGNKQPISKKFLFSMLRDIDVIDTESVMLYSGLSESYSSRLAQYLRVLSNSVDRLVDCTANGGIEINY